MSLSSVQQAHDVDALRNMALALDMAWELLPSSLEHDDGMRRRLAMLIVGHFERGEHDPLRLSELVVAEIDPLR